MKKNRFIRFFIPYYDELTLFVMSLVVILLCLTNLPENFSLNQMRFSDTHPGLIIVFLIFVAGLILPIFHAFSSATKTLIEKKVMLIFAVVINAFAGVWSATYILSSSHGWILVFPAWNIINSIMLFALLREGTIDESSISDENISIYELIIGAAIAFIAFFVCEKGLGLNWAATFSICIAYATNFNVPVVSLILRIGPGKV